MYSKKFNGPTQCFELIVIGLGLVGSSALYEAAKLLNADSLALSSNKKPRVLGIEQYEIPHKYGSSHGESRITRQAIGEGAAYVSLAIKSQNKLKEMHAKTNGKFGAIYYEDNTGVLIIGPKDNQNSLLHHTKGFLQTTQNLALRYQIPHVNFNSKEELIHHFKQFKFKEHEGAYQEQTIGIMDPEACIKAQIYLAQQENAEVHTNEKVLNFCKMDNGTIKVTTSKGEYDTNKLIIAAGPWMSDFVNPEVRDQLSVYRQTVFYFEVAPNYQEQFMLGHFPPFIWDLGRNECLYGFPIMQKGKSALKIGAEAFSYPTTPSLVNRTVSEREKREMYEQFIEPNLHGVLPLCTDAFVCLYTQTPDSQFQVDYLPGFEPKVIFAATCSGHGAKHSPAVGEALAQQMIWGYNDENILKLSETCSI